VHSAQDPTALIGYLLVGRPFSTHSELDLTAPREHHVRMGVHKTGKDHTAACIKFCDVLWESTVPVSHSTYPGDLSAEAKNPSVPEYAKLTHGCALLDPGPICRNGDKLRDVFKEEIHLVGEVE
jgi:hypothetical protein